MKANSNPKVLTTVLQLQTEWYPAIGAFAELRLHDQTVREGVIDAVTDDDAILWLAVDGIHLRQLFTREDGYQVWIDSPAGTEWDS